MSNPSDRFKELLWDRRTSPLYKTFIVSWCLWNRNFLYILLFESSAEILQEKSMLKGEYLKSIYKINRDQVFSFNFFQYTFNRESWIWHTLIWPLVSVALFFFVFNRLELRFRKHANTNKIKQNELDKILKEDDIEIQKLNNKEFEESLRQTQLLLEQKDQELELAKKSKEIASTHKSDEELWEEEYSKISNTIDFDSSMKTLEKLIDSNPNWDSNQKLYDQYKWTYVPYNLLSLDKENSIYKLTPKWGFFLKRFKESIFNK